MDSDSPDRSDRLAESRHRLAQHPDFLATLVVSCLEFVDAGVAFFDLSGEALSDLTERQREVTGAAYHAGYFDWPRNSTAEDVAETLDVAPPTLQAHLRKAESSLFAELFDGTANPEGGPSGE